MLTINTTRFGELEIDENRLILFPEGLLGFAEYKKYVILEHKPDSPFCWLQSMDSPGLAFAVINPYTVKNDYLEKLSPDEKEFFSSENGGETIVFAIVTIPPGKVEKMTVNLLGPLIIDVESKIGRQMILANAGYNHRHPLISN